MEEAEEQAGGDSTRLSPDAGPPFSHSCVGGLPTSPRLSPRSGPEGGAWSRYVLRVSRLKWTRLLSLPGSRDPRVLWLFQAMVAVELEVVVEEG